MPGETPRDRARAAVAHLARVTDLVATYTHKLPEHPQPGFVASIHSMRFFAERTIARPGLTLPPEQLYAEFTRWARTQPEPLNTELVKRIAFVDFKRHLDRYQLAIGELPALDNPPAHQTAWQTDAVIDILKFLDIDQGLLFGQPLSRERYDMFHNIPLSKITQSHRDHYILHLQPESDPAKRLAHYQQYVACRPTHIHRLYDHPEIIADIFNGVLNAPRDPAITHECYLDYRS